VVGEIEKVRGGFQPHITDFASPDDPVFDKWGDAVSFVDREWRVRARNAHMAAGLPSGAAVKDGGRVEPGEMVGMVERRSFVRAQSAWSVASPPGDNELPLTFVPAVPIPGRDGGPSVYRELTAPDGVVIPVPGNPVVVRGTPTPIERRVEAEVARTSPDVPGSMGGGEPLGDVGGRNPEMTGRHIPIRGTKVHVPKDAEWQRTFADGVRFHSPAGTTAVTRTEGGQSEIVSVPGGRLTHPEMQRTAPPGVTTQVARQIATDVRYPGSNGQTRPATPERPAMTTPVTAPAPPAPPPPAPPPAPPTGPDEAAAALAVRRQIATERAARAAAIQATTELPEPTEPTEPGSLAGVDLSGVHPKAIDSELARLNALADKAQHYLASTLKHQRERQAREDAHARRAGREPRVIEPHIGEEDRIAGYRAEIAALGEEMRPMNDEFQRRGGWARYFLVTNGNGHVHKSMECSTCYPTTEYGWLYDLAAKSEQAMVNEYGEKACSVCFPSAPSMYEAMLGRGELSTTARATMAERDARRALKAERDAKKAAKAIANPDGSPLRLSGRFGDRIGSLVTARTALVDGINDVRASQAAQGNGSIVGTPAYLAEKLADVEILVAALEHKLGIDGAAIRAEAQAKADVKWRRDYRNG
jgi:hypothetical protein